MNLAKIKKITRLGIKNTIDLEIDHPSHNFFRNEICFSNSHAVAYATTAQLCAYLKFNFPQQFFLSLLRMAQHEPDPFAEIFKIHQELPLFNIRLMPPDLAKSAEDFTIEKNDLRFG